MHILLSCGQASAALSRTAVCSEVIRTRSGAPTFCFDLLSTATRNHSTVPGVSTRLKLSDRFPTRKGFHQGGRRSVFDNQSSRLSSTIAMWSSPAIKKEAPGPGQESVWDYPRPPRLEKTPKHIKVDFNGVTIVDTKNAYRVLETSHPPTYYLPPGDLKMEHFTRSPGQRSFCEWKGHATYWSIKVGDKEARDVAWSYENHTPPFAAIKGYIAMYAAPMDGCYVDGEKASPQPGGFYGGWVTKDIVGPIKGIPGSMGW
eukprot:TRINITY_DN2439_c0_g1_i1.p1 TRINITY_DN2439_c0_g1~~TRINITY_DN2439_c0_g1_i1.p1  ORF type:complete len:258 (-),score=4.94 TRINITY_DN2439_c0_g1_i1:189-962(-)